MFTPEPLVLNVVVQDPKAENGEPFTYPDEEIDMLNCAPVLSGVYEEMFGPIAEALPKYCCEFDSIRFFHPNNWIENGNNLYWDELAIRALTRLTAFIRKCVKEMGEFWLVEHWIETMPQKPEDMVIIEMNVDDLKFKGDGVESFRFEKDTFYRFVDVVDSKDNACDLNDVHAQVARTDFLRLSRLHFEDQLKKAEGGDPAVLCELGACYLGGVGTKQDCEKAVMLFKKAADLGNAAAMRAIGLLYNSELEERDYEKAMDWLKKAADLGDTEAMRGIGFLYDFGHGVEQDHKKAMEWFKKAADLGNVDAIAPIIYYYQVGLGVEQNYNEATFWNKKAADLRSIEAQRRKKRIAKMSGQSHESTDAKGDA